MMINEVKGINLWAAQRNCALELRSFFSNDQGTEDHVHSFPLG